MNKGPTASMVYIKNLSNYFANTSVLKSKFIDLDGDHQSFAKGLIKGMIKADPLKRIQLEDVKSILL